MAIVDWLYFDYIYWFLINKIVLYPVKIKIESMEEHSEAKIYKSKPGLRSNVNTNYFDSSAKIFESVTWLLFTINYE